VNAIHPSLNASESFPVINGDHHWLGAETKTTDTTADVTAVKTPLEVSMILVKTRL
jgi:hypothetical protein